jgi:hypothetical protein
MENESLMRPIYGRLRRLRGRPKKRTNLSHSFYITILQRSRKLEKVEAQLFAMVVSHPRSMNSEMIFSEPGD